MAAEDMTEITDFVSPDYQALLQRQHGETKWGGNKNHRHINEVCGIIGVTRAASVLDYGSGREALRRDLEELSNVTVTCYDPGTERTALPGPADLVVALDVIEHIEPDKLDVTLAHIFSLAQKAIFLVIALRQAKALMVDGSPAHLIVESSEWWLRKLQPDGRTGPWVIKRSSAVEGKELKVLLVKRVVK